MYNSKLDDTEAFDSKEISFFHYHYNYLQSRLLTKIRIKA